GPAPLRVDATGLPRRGPPTRTAARPQGRRPPPRPDRVRSPRRRPPPRRARPPDRSERAAKRGDRGSRRTGPHCRVDARCKGCRVRTVGSRRGPWRRQRPYAHCRPGGRGTSPRDALLGRRDQDLPPAAAAAVCRAGRRDSCAAAAARVRRGRAGRRVAAPTAAGATETGAAGGRGAAALAAGQTCGPAQPWAWPPDAAGQAVAYVLADRTGGGLQGAKGAAAAGRLANGAVSANSVPEERNRWADRSPRAPPPAPARDPAGLPPCAG